jgi:hypothetical protein
MVFVRSELVRIIKWHGRVRPKVIALFVVGYEHSLMLRWRHYIGVSLIEQEEGRRSLTNLC